MEETVHPNTKKIILIAGIVLVVLMLIVFVIAALKSTQQSAGNAGGTGQPSGGGLFGLFRKPSSNVSPSAMQLSPSDVAKKDLDWLQKQKNTKGVYYGQISCNGNQCGQPVESNQSGIEPMWSRYMSYKKNHQASDLQILSADIDTYSNRTIVPRLQNRFWDCRLMYELWNDSTFTNDQKNKIKAICYDNQPFPPPDNAPDKADVDFSKVVQGRTFSSDLDVSADNLTDFSVMASDFAARYMWDKNQANLRVAQEYFKYAVVAYTKLTGRDTATPLLGIAAYDIYKAGNDKAYLDFANYIFDKVSAQRCSAIEECAYMIAFAKSLNASSQQSKYQDYITQSRETLMLQSYDYQGYEAYKNGFGAFHAFGQTNQVIYPIGLNALIAGLLVEQ